MNKWLQKSLPLIGVGLFVYLIISVGPNKIVETFLSSDKKITALSLLFTFPILLLQTYKWDMLLKYQKIKLEIFYLLKLYMVGLFYSLVTPGKLGSFLRIFYLKEKIQKGLAECSVNLVLERILDFIALFVLAIIGSLLLLQRSSTIFWALLGTFLLFISGVSFLLYSQQKDLLLKIVYNHLVPFPLKNRVKSGFKIFYKNLPNISKLTLPFLIGFLGWTLLLTQSYVISYALGIKIPYIHYITFITIGTIVGWLPISIGGFGTRDAALIYLLGILGVSAQKALSLSLISYTITSITPALLGGVFLISGLMKRNN